MTTLETTSKKTIYKSSFAFRNRLYASFAFTAALASATVAGAQVGTGPRSYPVPGAGLGAAPGPRLTLPALPAATPVTANGTVVADVLARVNDQIITRGEYERAQQQLLGEVQQGNGTSADLQARGNDLLRDMIDQQLLLSKGKELGITGDAETIRRLDEIRKQNHLDSMEALEKAATQQGYSFEDFKQSIRNNAVTQSVVRDEVGRRLQLTHAQEEAYYGEHSKEFEVPEQVHLSEILVPTPENATDAQVAQAQAKADELSAKLKGGANFAGVAKASSGGPTASAGGDLGDFKRGTLGTVLENATFPLAAGGETAPVRTRQGFVILRVDSHQAAGVPALAEVEPQVQEAIYLSALQPALRAYLSKAREEAYVDIKPGFIDTGATHREVRPAFTSYQPPPPKKKTVKKQQSERDRANKAQLKLAEAREKLALKKNAVVEQKAVSDDANAPAGTPGKPGKASKPSKPAKIRREKVRYGQAPRNSLPSAPLETTEVASPPLAGQAAGSVVSATDPSTTVTAGTGVTVAANVDPENPLAASAAPEHKSRFANRQRETEEKRAENSLAKAQVKASVRPIAATNEENVDEKQQAAPLGLNGDTAKKAKKHKRQKGEAKERLQDHPITAEAPPPPPASTVNPAALGVTPGSLAPAARTTPGPDPSAIPSTTAAPGAPQQGQPIPATTTTPGAPATTPPPPR